VQLEIKVKFQQRYQMRNRILSKAVPALEFCPFCNSGVPKQCWAFFARGSQETVCGGAEEVNPAAASISSLLSALRATTYSKSIYFAVRNAKISTT